MHVGGFVRVEAALSGCSRAEQQAEGPPADEDEPVELQAHQEAGPQVAGPGHLQMHLVQGDPQVPAAHRRGRCGQHGAPVNTPDCTRIHSVCPNHR